MNVHREENSSGIAKFFNPTSKSISWKSKTEKKAFTIASTLFGIATLGIGHGIYQIVKKATVVDPDNKKVKVSINDEGKIDNKMQIQDSKFGISGKNEYQNKALESRLSSLIEESLSPSIGLGYHGMVSDQNSVAYIRKNNETQQVYFEVSGDPGNLPTIEINGKELNRGEIVNLSNEENEIKFNGEMIFKFNLLKPEKKQ